MWASACGSSSALSRWVAWTTLSASTSKLKPTAQRAPLGQGGGFLITSMSSWSSRHDQVAGKTRQDFRSARGRDAEGLAELEAPVIAPHAEDHVKAHVGLEDRVIVLAEAGGPLAPIRRIAEADRIADARALGVSRALDHPAPGRLHLVTGASGARGVERTVEALGDDFREIDEVQRRLSQIERPGERRVIAMVATAE